MGISPQEVVAGLTQYVAGWRGPLPASAGIFFGHTLGVMMETMPVEVDGGPPPPLPGEVELLGAVLAEMPDILARAEREFLAFTLRDKSARRQVFEPQVFISRDDTEDHPTAGRWALWVRRADNPVFAYNIEFARTKFLEVWSGD